MTGQLNNNNKTTEAILQQIQYELLKKWSTSKKNIYIYIYICLYLGRDLKRVNRQF